MYSSSDILELVIQVQRYIGNYQHIIEIGDKCY